MITLKSCKHPRYPWRVSFRQGEKYEQRYFTTKDEAKAFESEKKIELLNEGRKHGDFTDAERRAVIDSRELAEKFAKAGVKDFTLEKALSFYAAHVEACGKSVSVLTAYDEYYAAKAKAKKSTRYLGDIEGRLKTFADKQGKRLVAELTRRDIESYLHGLTVGTVTMLGHHRMIHGFLTFCVFRGYAESNVASKFEKPKTVARPPGILTPKETTKLLTSASTEIVPALAIGFFAGLRRAEIERLDWEQVDLKRGFIEVTAQNAKTAQRRLVTIQNNLKAWLRPYKKLSGLVRPSEQVFRDRLEDARKTAKLKLWPSNACRHSFASYHLALKQDAAATALQLGHSNTKVLFKHYRELTHPSEAKAYFAIKPKKKAPSNIIRIGKIAA